MEEASMRTASGAVPLAAAALVIGSVVGAALACQRAEEETGAPVDEAPVGRTDTAPAPGAAPPAAPGAAGGGDELAVGKQVYEVNCATCHGQNGDGKGPAGAGLQPPPAAFTDGEWKYGGDLESVRNTIINGIPGTAMIAWKGTLTDAEIDAVAKHEIAFSQGGATASAR
jgi:high-affinity iron transporter